MAKRFASAKLEHPEYPLVSIVIPTKNRHDSLRRLLASIVRHNYPKLEVIIVDDGSDVPVTIEAEDIPGLRLLRLLKSEGGCAARNAGIEKAVGEFIVIVDDDAEFNDEYTIARAVGLLSEQPDYGAVGFRQLWPDGSPHYMQPAAVDYPCFTAVFFGYGALLRRQAMAKAGEFNPIIGNYYEENEFCLRLFNVGYKSIYDPGLRVIHHHDETGRDSIKMHRLVLRNSVITALLHAPLWSLGPQIIMRLILFVKLSYADQKRIDWVGLQWSLREIGRSFASVKRSREAMPIRTLLRFRRLSRTPVPIP
jgi:GT2 family glycosyltransferase